MFDSGEKVVFHYPVGRSRTVVVEPFDSCFVRRRIEIHSIRDLVVEPLTVSEYLRRPLLRRSRWLVTGFDLDRQKWRKFYVGQMAEYRANSLLRIGLYEPGERRPYHVVSRSFGNSASERQLLAKLLAKLSRENLDGLQLGVFSDDLRLVS